MLIHRPLNGRKVVIRKASAYVRKIVIAAVGNDWIGAQYRTFVLINEPQE